MRDATLTVVNRYDLKQSAEDFRAAISALAARVEREGHAGVLSYRFFLSEVAGQARAVIDYADPDAWMGHHHIAMGWPEMAALHAVAALEEITFLGNVSAEITDWLASSGLKARVNTGYGYAAGFRRA